MEWNVKTVNDLVARKLKGFSIIAVSNREPYTHVHTDNVIKCKTPAGGLTAALDPVMQACHGVWIAHGSGDADREVVNQENRVRVPEENPQYYLKRVWLTKKQVDGFYLGFSNQAFWPLCHALSYQRPIFNFSQWEYYKEVNQIYADACIEEINKNKKSLVFLQDYHLALAPKMIKDAKANEHILTQFWHIPWPPQETFNICPWKEEIIEGMLANDLFGFHIQSYCKNFLDTAAKVLGADVNYKKSVIKYNGHKTFVKPFPISIDYEVMNNRAKTPAVDKEIENIKSKWPYEFLAVGVDRVDYTKGIPERLMAIDRFLEKYPEFQKRFVYVSAAAISRESIEAYKEINERIEKLVEEINEKYSTDNWQPIIYLKEKLNPDYLSGLYRRADVCIVSPVHDGMNLVTKEFIANQTDLNGVLILSPFTGAAKELYEALIVNPYDTETFADMIKKSLEVNDKKERMQRLREQVKTNNIFKWIGDIFSEVAKLS